MSSGGVCVYAELNLGFSKKEVIPSLPLKEGGSSLPSHKKKKEGAKSKSMADRFILIQNGA